ncbi:MAG: NADH-quinone oxidoreductase subunit K [Candidatus Diapherotrites archaeon]|nr:NADH-quinone oxidoreductase subunit K [Candidatus Diapherotrites archaeon]
MSDFVVLANLAGVACFFCIGLYALISKANLTKIIIALELIGKSTTLCFILGGFANGETGQAQAIVFTIIVIEVLVAAMALALAIMNKRTHGSIRIEKTVREKAEEAVKAK